MTDTTPRLALPLLAAAQAQKHVTHNEALVALDRLVHLTALDRRNTPPATPVEGDAHLVGDTPSDAFAGHAATVATFDGSAWSFAVPARGWIVWLANDKAALVFDGTGWADLKPRSADHLGIATSADDTNRLAVASPAVLFTHAGAGTQVKLNKAASTDTASLLFQTGWSGRAEMGTAGDNRFRVKVSADGSAWTTAMTVEPATAATGFGNESPLSRLDILGDTARMAQIKARSEAGGAQLGGGMILHHNNAAGALPVSGDRLGYLFFGTTIGGMNYQGGGIAARAEADFSSTSLPTYFAFETAPAGTTTRSERLRIASDGRVGIGTPSPTARLNVSENAAPLPSPPGGTIFHAAHADGVQSRFLLDSFGQNAIIAVRRANGTAAAPSALNANDLIGGLSIFGYGATGYPSGSRVQFRGSAAENWSDMAQGAYGSVFTTPVGTTTSVEVVRFAANGNVGIGQAAPTAKLDVDGPVRVKSYAVAALPSAAAGTGQIIMISDESGGAVLAFSDGTNWRRVTDRAVAS